MGLSKQALLTGFAVTTTDLQVLMRVRGITDPAEIKPELDDIVEVWFITGSPC